MQSFGDDRADLIFVQRPHECSVRVSFEAINGKGPVLIRHNNKVSSA